MRFKRVKERLVYETQWTKVYDDDVIMPDGSPGRYARVLTAKSEGGAHVVPRLPDGRVLLMKANRYPVGADVWEFPRGIPDEGESFEQAARRELEEETGLRASRMVFIGHLYPDTGIMGTRHSVFLAELPAGAEKDLKPAAREGILEGRFVAPDTVRELIAAGDIVDGTVLAELMLLRMHEQT
jgi:8-oxo-dGTP pyrophosphatase MutT (NUDIX family)